MRIYCLHVKGESIKEKLQYCCEFQVVQVYMSWDPSNWAAALRQLVGYERVFIKNGDAVSVNFEILGEQMEVWVDDNKGFNVLNGQSCAFRIYTTVIFSR